LTVYLNQQFTEEETLVAYTFAKKKTSRMYGIWEICKTANMTFGAATEIFRKRWTVY